MTTKDKEELLSYIKNRYSMYAADVYDDERGLLTSIPCYAVADVEAAINELVEESERKVQRNYEADYDRMVELATNMENEANRWKDIACHHEEELERLRLVIKTIEFVSGRKLEV